jgi:hypothetical protein
VLLEHIDNRLLSSSSAHFLSLVCSVIHSPVVKFAKKVHVFLGLRLLLLFCLFIGEGVAGRAANVFFYFAFCVACGGLHNQPAT